MVENFADRLLGAIDAAGAPVCVGLDPRAERLPDALRGGAGALPLDAIRTFCLGVLDAVAGVAPAVKPQIACFEALGPAGYELYFELVAEARRRGLLVIGDVKRSDIGSSAELYARGHLAADPAPDAITVNAYLGDDTLAPFVEAAAAAGKGLFALVRTSNPSAPQVQDVTDANGATVYEHVADLVAAAGADERLIGARGYSAVGAVVGATYPDEACRLRERMPQQIFLVPGYGAQGATAGDCAAAFKADGTGAIVNASRSVIYAFADERYAGRPWQDAVADAARRFADDVAGAVGR
ncbi:MAG: orotidine-5'-phosphate decarboxylase [Phycisphaerae bacterium]|nr:orotidine-5'-phosphate decarboxylase [Phycisphaerae bacterium]